MTKSQRGLYRGFGVNNWRNRSSGVSLKQSMTGVDVLFFNRVNTLLRGRPQRWHKYLVYKYKYKYIGLPLAMQTKLNKIHESWLS